MSNKEFEDMFLNESFIESDLLREEVRIVDFSDTPVVETTAVTVSDRDSPPLITTPVVEPTAAAQNTDTTSPSSNNTTAVETTATEMDTLIASTTVEYSSISNPTFASIPANTCTPENSSRPAAVDPKRELRRIRDEISRCFANKKRRITEIEHLFESKLRKLASEEGEMRDALERKRRSDELLAKMEGAQDQQKSLARSRLDDIQDQLNNLPQTTNCKDVRYNLVSRLRMSTKSIMENYPPKPLFSLQHWEKPPFYNDDAKHIINSADISAKLSLMLASELDVCVSDANEHCIVMKRITLQLEGLLLSTSYEIRDRVSPVQLSSVRFRVSLNRAKKISAIQYYVKLIGKDFISAAKDLITALERISPENYAKNMVRIDQSTVETFKRLWWVYHSDRLTTISEIHKM